MRLTVYSDYALRLMIYLALKGERLSTIAEVAEAYDISKAHLMKITHELGQKGLIDTVRGRQGGMRLARGVEQIGVGEIVRACEPDFAIVPCMENTSEIVCVVQPACVLKRALAAAAAAFLDVLDGYTLADLTRPSMALRRLLALPEPDARAGRPA
ncbi:MULTISPECIES: Rrf2 family transcriptional regulator [unclassified Rhizobium]|uniref:RrF2 family transcriptional regulator n=1 Tax=unclassified Rhizobium TaxID=2613769 RepID=UPI0010531AAA|nr:MULTISPECIES: Rrf2 family transcriptional regulator [unclassified Rhizobium]MBB3393576.1 Rrf2 family nitric oxide-sensitive transcriptional repressor [Rhizobium sp. BK060]MBB4166293.1 Rrf2 family nitric oxide-sensitive transcriptional repressor [Rhizobium sp. BK538]TCM81818.1 BadM/Rrf2 family transcriptional regulator [Rhizobium sp. BK068]